MVQIETLNGRLSEQAVRDPLTRLHNRRFLDEAIAAEVSRTTREQTHLSIAMLDVDRFKQVNDTYGHRAGDLVLLCLADMLRDNVRRSDLVCRLGGDEFVVIMPGASLDAARERAEAWRRAFEGESIDIGGGQRISITLSIGVVQYRHGKEEISETFRRADANLYRAKRSGRNRVVRSEGDRPQDAQ